MTISFVGRGLYALRPAYCVAGGRYVATDEGVEYEFDGTTWSIVHGEFSQQWNPMLAPGDLIGGGSNGVAVRIPVATADGKVLTSKASATGGMGWEAGGGGSGLLTSATVVLTNSQILNIFGTPVTLVTPSAGTGVLPVSAYAIHDFRNGTYTDPDQSGDIGIFDGVTGGRWSIITPISDADNPVQYGASKFLTYGPVLSGGSVGQSGWLGYLNDVTGTPVPQGIGPFILKKAGPSEFTDGGSGNTLTVTLYYIAVSTT